MKKAITISVACCLLFSCGNNKSNPPAGDSLSIEEQEAERLRLAEEKSARECADLRPDQFCDMGLPFIQLGDSVTWKVFTVEGAVQKDTVFEEAIVGSQPPEMIDWNATRLRFSDGDIWLETDTETDLFLSRIRVETPRYVSPGGLKVGMTFAELQQKEPDIFIRSFPAKNLVEVIAHGQLILHLENHGYFDPAATEAVEIQASAIKKDEKVIRIVLI